MNNEKTGLVFLTSGGAMGRAIAAADWSRHALGPVDDWTPCFRTALSMVLNSGFPSYVAWGPEFYVFYNDAYIPILGAKVALGQGRPLGELWHEIKDTACAIATRAFHGESPFFKDMPFVLERHGQPEQTYFTFSYSPIRDEFGVVRGVLGTIVETTDKVVALARLQESEARLQLSLDASGNIGTWSVDLETKTTVVDARFARLFQVDAALAQSGTELERFTNMIHPDDRVRVNAVIAHAIANGTHYEIDYRIPQLSGKVIWVGVKGGTFDNSVTGKKRFAGVAVDITERKQAAEELRLLAERQAFQLTLADRLRPLTATADIIAAATELLGIHTGAARVFYTEVDAAQRNFTIRQDWTAAGIDSMAGVEGTLADFGPELIAALMAGKFAVVDDVERDGLTAVHAQAYRKMGIGSHLAIPLVKSGRLLAILVIHKAGAYAWSARDVQCANDVAERTWSAVESAHLQALIGSERKKVEQDLNDAARRKDEFLAMLAHELRNPLAPIGAAAELLSIATLDQAGVRRTSAVISRQVRHMTSLVDDLLDVSRVTRGLVTLEMEQLDARRVVADAVEQVRPLIEARGHRFTLDQAPQAMYVRGDQKRLVQVLANLLNNAAKYTPAGGNIALRSDVLGDQLRLAVIDDGIGMQPEMQERAFELFAQAERSSDRAQGGLGLGLALVKSLVELHQGGVGAHSAGAGRGSTFTVCLPLVAAPDPVAAPAGEPAAGRAPRGLRLMIVDDNADAASMLAMLLEACGHTVTVEQDGRGALERARLDAPDVCLLDIGLPDMDGNELARRLRLMPQTHTTTLIAVTGYGQALDRSNSAAAGFDHHLVKPLDAGQLARLLSEVTPA